MAAVAAESQGKITFGYRCAKVESHVWLLNYFPLDEKDMPALRTTVDQTLASWVWK